MIDTKSELRYILLTRLLEKAAAAGLLTLEELYAAKRLARDKYRPQTVWEAESRGRFHPRPRPAAARFFLVLR